MCKAIKNLCIFTYSLNSKTIILLIQKESGLLTVFHINNISNAIFIYMNLCVKFVTNKPFIGIHPLVFSDFCIASFINTLDYYTIIFKYIF